MQVSGSFEYVRFNSKAYNAAVRKQIVDLHRAAAKAMFQPMIAIMVQHVDSGMAIGSLTNLGRWARATIPGISRKSLNKKYYHAGGKARGIKSPALGEKFSTSGKNIFRNSVAGKFKFEYNVKTFHYTLNDFFGIKSNSGVPWNTFALGRDAFMNFFRSNAIDALPDPAGFMLKTTITFGRGSGISKTEKPLRSRKQVTIKP